MEKYKVTAPFDLNVRSSPNKETDDNIIGILKKNDFVDVIQHSEDEYWYYIQKDDLKGWSSHKYLRKIFDRYKVLAYGLNVREEPGLTSTIIGTLNKNDVVEITNISEDNYWYYIKKGTLEGWSSHKFLRRVREAAPQEEFPWMAIALDEIGVKAIPGSMHNQRILQYLQSTNLGRPDNEKDETAWCSAFVNWCVEQSGFEGTDSASARSWEHWGQRAREPKRGCVVVFWRQDPYCGLGHVGFFMDDAGGTIRVLGGNQSNAVNVKFYSKDRLLSYRVPA